MSGKSLAYKGDFFSQFSVELKDFFDTQLMWQVYFLSESDQQLFQINFFVPVCVCMRKREREREMDCECVCVRVCVLCVRERVRMRRTMNVYVCCVLVREWQEDRLWYENVCMCVREGERVCVVCVCMYVCMFVFEWEWERVCGVYVCLWCHLKYGRRYCVECEIVVKVIKVEIVKKVKIRC